MRWLGDAWQWLFDAQHFTPRGQCGPWTSATAAAYIGGHLLVFLAYLAIPLGLVFLWLESKESPRLRRVTVLFATFILLCGLGHLFDGVLSFIWPAYHFFAVWHVATGLVSVLTAVVLLRRLAELMARPSPELYQMLVAETEALRDDYLQLLERSVHDKQALVGIGQKFEHLAETVKAFQHERPASGKTD